MERGYVKLWRSIDQNDLLENDNTALIVFIKLLTRVNRHNGKYTTGRNKFANVCNLNPNTLYSALKRLEASTIIQQQSNKVSTTITICNWATYQQDDNKTASQRQSTVNTKQEKKENIDTKVSISKAIQPRKQISSDIDSAFKAWDQVMGYPIVSGVKKNRYAASNLIKSNGLDKLINSLQVVRAASLDRYHGVKTADFVEMQQNMNKINKWKTDFGKHIDTDKNQPKKGLEL